MKKQSIELPAGRSSYAPPVCEEIPVLAEGTLCSSGDSGSDDESDIGNESVGETPGSW